MTIRLRLFALAGIFAILLASCGPQTALVSTAIPTPAATPISRAPEIRFALIGKVTDVNVWALFDAKGYSYNNYAVRNEYWPRLYRLSIPGRQFEPMAASGMPSPVQREGNFFTATVPLRPDLTWTDGSPFTAEDVAFTVNTALSFQLGFDWRDFYNPDYLDRAEIVDAQTVKFFFKKQPNVGVWQYGALQGPIVQKAYWSEKVTDPAALLPPNDLASQIERLKVKVDDLQQKVNALNLSIASAPMTSAEAQRAQAALTRQQSDLNEANNDIAKAQSNFDNAMNAAHESLYALDDTDEPTLGNWIPAGQDNGAWINKVNPAFPFGEPKFDRAVYHVYQNQGEGFDAFQSNKVDEYLSPAGIQPVDVTLFNNKNLMRSSNHNAEFLVFNQSDPQLADGILRKAFGCSLNGIFSENLIVATNPLNSFIQSKESFWYTVDGILPCGGLNDLARLLKSVEILKTAGYSWDSEPTSNNPGKGIKSPGGEYLPPITLLSRERDPRSPTDAYGTPGIVEKQMNYLGINVNWQTTDAQNVNYAVFSSHQYDMAILGWRLGEYPSYLCDWFGGGNPFGYNGDRLKSQCEALISTSDLGQARKQAYEIQSILAQDLPFIPLYSGVTYDAYRNINYPFDSVPGGLSGIYGAPSLAVPASQ